MALPTSGPISMSMVATEFLVNQSNISLNNLGAQLANPQTQNIELANDFYGQSDPAALTSFSYRAAAEGVWESAEAACVGSPEVENSIGYSTANGIYQGNAGFVYTANNTANPFPAGWYVIVVGKERYPFNVSSNTSNGAGANGAAGDPCEG